MLPQKYFSSSLCLWLFESDGGVARPLLRWWVSNSPQYPKNGRYQDRAAVFRSYNLPRALGCFFGQVVNPPPIRVAIPSWLLFGHWCWMIRDLPFLLGSDKCL